MHGNKGFNWFVVALGFVLFLGLVTPIADLDDNNLHPTMNGSELVRNVIISGTPHAPIVIDGDANFTLTASNEGWIGDGSSGNPFIINGLDIDRDGSAGHCINISNTQVNFTISNCNLTGANVDSGAGIYLDNVKNARIVDNICQQNTHGVFIQGRGSKNCTLTNNTCTKNSVSGIQLVACLNISLMQRRLSLYSIGNTLSSPINFTLVLLRESRKKEIHCYPEAVGVSFTHDYHSGFIFQSRVYEKYLSKYTLSDSHEFAQRPLS